MKPKILTKCKLLPLHVNEQKSHFYCEADTPLRWRFSILVCRWKWQNMNIVASRRLHVIYCDAFYGIASFTWVLNDADIVAFSDCEKIRSLDHLRSNISNKY